jgi:hypothetical protein
MDRSDVRKYIQEYTTYFEKREESEKSLNSLSSSIATKKA